MFTDNQLLLMDTIAQLEHILSVRKKFESDLLEEKLYTLMNIYTRPSQEEAAQTVKILYDFTIPVREIYQRTYIEVERNIARSILEGKSGFTNYLSQRYKNLIHNELLLFNTYVDGKKSRKMLFVGAGPLPISPLFFALKDENVTIHVLDSDDEAVHTARAIIAKYHLDHRIKILAPCRVQEFPWIEHYDIVCIAGMVGMTEEEKIEIYTNVAKNITPGTILFTRTTRNTDLSYFTYAPFPVDQLKNHYDALMVLPSVTDVNVYSLVLKRK